jgi:outer membrane receptor protein involved in Fe transport
MAARPDGLRRGASGILLCTPLLLASPAARAGSYEVPPGPLGQVLARIGAAGHATILVTDPVLGNQASRGVHDAHSLHGALRQAIRGIDARAQFIDPHTIRVSANPRLAAPPAPMAIPATLAQTDILVTASKQAVGLDHYPGSAKIIATDRGWLAENAASGTGAIARLLPILASTNLGDGRDKLFIRGIADSSFNGPTQSTVGEYLGDIRLNYNAPDPNLNLYDMERVEVLVGPQGTLYGAGTLGGIIRFVPNAPDSHAAAATASAGISNTWSGAVGEDGAAMVNLPLAHGKAAVRMVAYGSQSGGYIDDPSRGLKNINGSSSYGQRLSVRLDDLGGWRLDLGMVFQNLYSADGQYTLLGMPELTRESAIAQPFHNNERMGYVSGRRALSWADLTGSLGFVKQDLSTVFDATGYDDTATPARYTELNDLTLFTGEFRLSGHSRRHPWVLGASTLYNASVLMRRLGPLNEEAALATVVNTRSEGALFGEVSFSLGRRLTATVGERLTIANSGGFLVDTKGVFTSRVNYMSARLSHTLAFDWHPGGPVSAFFHYQQGYRPGGLSVAASGNGVQSQRFETDNLSMDELGLRYGKQDHDRLWLRGALFFADWANIQADLVGSNGLITTANIGHGLIYGLDGEIGWHPAPAWTLSAAAFLNDSRLSDPAPAYASSLSQTLPNVARGGIRGEARWNGQWRQHYPVSAGATMRYIGRSVLGVGADQGVTQGGYIVLGANARVQIGRLGLSVMADNLGNVRSNTFSFGNPFGLAQGNQITPLRPRTIRFGLDTKF